ncbi:hypothetical protein [Pseudomonas sp. HY13-MNA-CIBAN-0226]|uniref:hypothetical protein n=1 Tax=Pseudomonas sp. HY13-MNA-CIBAN-0226 TaxID=3140473 RepID=UPI0033307D01
MEAIPKQATKFVLNPHFTDMRLDDRLSVKTEDGREVVLVIGSDEHRLSAVQADILAQGFLMASLRTKVDCFNVPWEKGEIHEFVPEPGKRKRQGVRVEDSTWYGENQTYSFVAVGWIYEKEGEDPSYPANVVFIRTTLEGDVGFKKGDDEYLFSSHQAITLCQDLSDAAYSLRQRRWMIWDNRIDWHYISNKE